MIISKEKLIATILDTPERYIENSHLFDDLSYTSRTLKLTWDTPIVNYSELPKIRAKIDKDFKAVDDKNQKKQINEFVGQMVGNGLPRNTFYSNAEFGFAFKKNNFDLYIDEEAFNGDEVFKGNILCLGTDEHYDYYVISPDFSGVRKVYHDSGIIETFGFEKIECFAGVVMKFSMTQGALEKGLLNKADIVLIISKVKSKILKELLSDLVRE